MSENTTPSGKIRTDVATAVYKLHDFGHRTVPATEHSTMVGLCKPSNRS